MNLTTEQLQAAEKGPVTVEVEGKEYVLLSRQVYDRVKQVLYDDSDELPSSKAIAGLVRETMAEDDANDPLLESYQKYKRTS